MSQTWCFVPRASSYFGFHVEFCSSLPPQSFISSKHYFDLSCIKIIVLFNYSITLSTDFLQLVFV